MSDLKEWKLYEDGKRYNNKLDPPYYKTCDVNWDFFNGNQWKNVKSNGMPTPVFNIIKRTVTFFVSTLMANKIRVKYTPLEHNSDEEDGQISLPDIADAEVDNLFDKFNMDQRIREALFDAAITGDAAAHFWFDVNKTPYGGQLGEYEGEIQMELIDGSNVYFGNANNSVLSIDTQPYVIISGRDTVENLKREAEEYKQNQEDTESISSDNPDVDTMGSKEEVDTTGEIEGDRYGKVNYIIMYKYNKDSKTVSVTKCTQNTYIYKDVDTGLTRYPIAWLNWESQKNQYHGRAVCTGMIPNQIFINRMFAMVMYNLMMTAFPKAVYNGDVIKNFSNQIGEAIKITGMSPGDNIKNYASYMEPGNMSNQIVQVLELAIKYTKETLGVNDAMMGDVNPEVASGKSIIATVNQSVVPLENVRANMYGWIEEIGNILIDIMANNYGLRPVIVANYGQDRKRCDFDFTQLRNVYLNCKCDVGATSYWSEIAGVETLDNLFKQGAIDVIDYLEAMPEGYIPHKQDLIDKLKEKQVEQQEMQMMMSQGGESPLGAEINNDGM